MKAPFMISIKALLFLSFFPLSVFFQSADIYARPYIPANDIVITSETRSFGAADNFKNIRRFHVIPEKTNSDTFLLKYYLEGSDHIAAKLEFSVSGDAGAYDLTLNGRQNDSLGQHLIVKDHLFIAPGFSIPCDILPVAQVNAASRPLIYETKQEAGGRTFVSRLKVECINVSVDEAYNSGWLKPGVEISSRLKLIKITNAENNHLVVQQLWPEDRSFWIYEETPYRKSWLEK